MPSATKNLFEKRFLDLQKLLSNMRPMWQSAEKQIPALVRIKVPRAATPWHGEPINNASGVAGRSDADSIHSPHIGSPRRGAAGGLI